MELAFRSFCGTGATRPRCRARLKLLKASRPTPDCSSVSLPACSCASLQAKMMILDPLDESNRAHSSGQTRWTLNWTTSFLDLSINARLAGGLVN